jgi:hypothetical protein
MLLELPATAYAGELFGIGSASHRIAGSYSAITFDKERPNSCLTPSKMSSSKVALLIGGITHSRKEWEALSSVASLKVRSVQKVGWTWWG